MCACRAGPSARPSIRARSRGGAGRARAWQPPRQRRRRLSWRPARAARTPRTASRPQRPPGDPPAFCASARARAPASRCEADAAASAPGQGASCCLVLFAWVAKHVRVTPGSDTYMSGICYAGLELACVCWRLQQPYFLLVLLRDWPLLCTCTATGRSMGLLAAAPHWHGGSVSKVWCVGAVRSVCSRSRVALQCSLFAVWFW